MVVVSPIGTPFSSLPPQVVDSGRSSNGRTADSGSAYRGSNPCLPATLPVIFLSTVGYQFRVLQPVSDPPTPERSLTVGDYLGLTRRKRVQQTIQCMLNTTNYVQVCQTPPQKKSEIPWLFSS